MKLGTMFKQKTVARMLTAVFIIFSLLLVKNAVAMPPLNVGLVSYTATPQNNAALLEWETASELGTAGFSIQRQSNGGTFEDISGFIDSEGGVAVGSTYSYVDNTAVNNQTYTYRLIEHETSNHDIDLGDRQITIGLQATATPITAGGGGNSNSNPTATSIATSTPASATATAEPTEAAEQTAVSATTFPTAVPTRNSNNTTTQTPTATSVAANSSTSSQSDSQNDGQGDVVEVNVSIAQVNTPIPTSEAYPGETATDTPPLTNDDYPANAEQPLVEQTPTPYPVAIESINNSSSGSDGVNVIGSDAPDGSSNTTENAEGNSSNFYLWFGFFIALLIFIVGLIGSAVLFTRKK